jgi:probable HAF family extracellular repeat protein
MFLAARPATAAPRYTCKALPPMPGYPSNINQPTCINNLAQASGYAQGPKQTFLYTNSSGAMQALGTLLTPYTLDSYGYGINDAGQVVGKSDSSSYGYYHAFLWTSGVGMQDLGGLPGFTDAVAANGINGAGQVVGTSTSKTSPTIGYYRAFRWTPGSPATMEDLGGLNATVISAAYGINAAGQVVGTSYWGSGSSGGIYHAFLWTSGSPATIENLGALPSPYDYSSKALSVNAAVQVVGTSSATSSSGYGSRAFIWTRDGGIQSLGTLPSPYDYAYSVGGINAAGQVVGYCWSSSNSFRGWLYSGGVMTDLTSLVQNLPTGVTISMANGINDRGQIIASGSDGKAYLLTPVSSLAGLDLLLLQ